MVFHYTYKIAFFLVLNHEMISDYTAVYSSLVTIEIILKLQQTRIQSNMWNWTRLHNTQQ